MAEVENKESARVTAHSGQETGNLRACLKSYYLSSKFTGMTIITAEKEFKVHKLLACSRSGYFARMFDGDWLESATNTVKLQEDEPLFVQAMIDFMYGIIYDSTEHGQTSSILFHVGAYQIADKYDIPQLKEHAKSMFEDLVTIAWNMDDFPPVISAVYQTIPICDRGLRDPLVHAGSQNFSDLLEKTNFVEVFDSTPGFASDMAKHLLRENQELKSDTSALRCGW
ncbi:uncharacterized protein BJX67DRAFT_388264 [Aspergillus lucknowensis]|uniref:BTB domain-containing protein n=1 Tax=Aspergillus lucknowensis TaxID=176173 RepID=A0ABR4LR81_9EURO